MQIEELVPFWAKLTKEEQEELKNRILVQNVKKGTIIHNGSEDCTGLIIVEEDHIIQNVSKRCLSFCGILYYE